MTHPPSPVIYVRKAFTLDLGPNIAIPQVLAEVWGMVRIGRR